MRCCCRLTGRSGENGRHGQCVLLRRCTFWPSTPPRYARISSIERHNTELSRGETLYSKGCIFSNRASQIAIKLSTEMSCPCASSAPLRASVANDYENSILLLRPKSVPSTHGRTINALPKEPHRDFNQTNAERESSDDLGKHFQCRFAVGVAVQAFAGT